MRDLVPPSAKIGDDRRSRVLLAEYSRAYFESWSTHCHRLFRAYMSGEDPYG
jgi:hypothetical protein